MNSKHVRLFVSTIFVTYMLSLTGCGAMPESPPQTNKFKYIVDEQLLKVGDSAIKDSKSKVIAIIYSENVDKQLNYNKSIAEIVSKNMLFEINENVDDYSIVMSEEKLLAAIVSKLKNKFAKIVLAKDIPSAFSNKADYVGILDIRLDLITNHSQRLTTHVANTSLLLINRRLESGPEIKSMVTDSSTYEYDAVSNKNDPLRYYRALVYRIKLARTKMINDFGTDLDSKVFN